MVGKSETLTASAHLPLVTQVLNGPGIENMDAIVILQV